MLLQRGEAAGEESGGGEEEEEGEGGEEEEEGGGEKVEREVGEVVEIVDEFLGVSTYAAHSPL